jgi:predicted outer membrane repeat protein
LTGNGIDPTIGGIYTEIRGEQSGVLAKNKSPFFVSGNITVNTLDTLIIQRGVELFFKEKTSLIVNGVLITDGTRFEPIRFTAFEYDWEGIHIINPVGSSSLIFCIFEYIYLPRLTSAENGAIEIENASVEIKNCYFQNNYVQNGGGLAITNSNVTLINNVFYKNTADVYGGAIFSQNSSNQIINNTFYKNNCYNYGGGLVIAEPVNEDLQNNIFFDNFSYRGDSRIAILLGDSSNIYEQYNFLAFGTMDPLFISEDNLQLSEISPCINSGNPLPEFNDPDGSRNDQGAYGGPNGDW